MFKKFMGGLFTNKNYLLLWLGQIVSNLGNRIHSIAVMWYVLNLTGSSLQMGTTLLFTELPYVLISPLAGSLVDRLNRKKIIVYSDIVNGFLVGLISILIFRGEMKIWMLYLISSLISISKSFFNPALQSLIPMIVNKENLSQANSFKQVSTNIATVIGPGLGGALIPILGIPGLFLLDSISYLLSGCSEVFISIKPILMKTQDNILEHIKEGLSFAYKHKNILYFLLIGGLINFLIPLHLIIPIFVKKVLKRGSNTFGLLMSSLSLGSLTISIFASKLIKKAGTHFWVGLGLSLEGVFLILLTLSDTLLLAAISLILYGMALGIVNISLITEIQLLIPDEIMGRVFSILSMLVMASTPLGYFLGGLILENITVKLLMYISGTITILIALTTFKFIGQNKNRTESKYVK